MSHHEHGAPGTENKSCCTPGAKCCRDWRSIITGLSVVVAVCAVSYALVKKNEAPSMEAVRKEVKAEKNFTGDDKVVLKIDGKDVMKSDVYALASEVAPGVPAQAMAQLYPMFIEQYINVALMNKAAEKENIASTDEVRGQLAIARDQIVRAAYLKKVFDSAITEDQLKQAYDVKFVKPGPQEEVRARHILVETEQQAKDLIAKLNGGASFETLAKENSKDGTAQRGGDLGYFKKADMVKEFADAAFAMTKGQTSKTPVRTQFGWHVIKLEDKREGKVPTFEEAKPSLEQEVRQAVLEGKLKEMREQAKVEIVDKDLEKKPEGGAPAVDPAAAAPAGAAPAAAPAGEAAPAPAPAQ